MPFAALILDLDGVLADTEPIHARAWEAVLEGIPREAISRAREWWVGMASLDIARQLIRELGIARAAEELVAEKRRHLRDLVRGALAPFPGLARELEEWKGFPLALATAGARREAALMLEIMGFRGLFDPVVTLEDVARPKPAPDCYLLAAKLLGKKPEECTVVEDSTHGVRAGVDAGMRVLAVSASPPPHALVAGAEAVFPSTVEALRWLRG